MNKIYPSFKPVIKELVEDFKTASKMVHTEKWQGLKIHDKPEMATYELLNRSFSVQLISDSIGKWQNDIGPNLPWAEDHFKERVCGEPLNPGEQWKHWPWGNSADKFRDENGQFNHNYMERYWPKYAGKTDKGELKDTIFDKVKNALYAIPKPNKGIRHEYGDLDDVINLLADEPNTRQAYLPIFFPEDTGGGAKGRVPCSLGYHFIHRNGYLHIVYYLRSCDMYRHFRDDCYMTVRLLLHVLERLKATNKAPWDKVLPGIYTMHITSLHCFRNDLELLS